MSGLLARALPTIRLSDVAFSSRHRMLTAILWLHLPLIVGVAVLAGHGGVHVGGHTQQASQHAGAIAEQTELAARTRASVVASADQVTSTVSEFRRH
jgi:hypothetical protein